MGMTAMPWRRPDFPVQPRPIYMFQIRDGRLSVRRYDRYTVSLEGRRQEPCYRLHTGTGIKTKSQGQLDKIRNRALWTFDPDAGRAISKFLERAEADLVHIAAMLQSAQDFLEECRAAQAGH